MTSQRPPLLQLQIIKSYHHNDTFYYSLLIISYSRHCVIVRHGLDKSKAPFSFAQDLEAVSICSRSLPWFSTGAVHLQARRVGLQIYCTVCTANCVHNLSNREDAPVNAQARLASIRPTNLATSQEPYMRYLSSLFYVLDFFLIVSRHVAARVPASLSLGRHFFSSASAAVVQRESEPKETPEPTSRRLLALPLSNLARPPGKVVGPPQSNKVPVLRFFHRAYRGTGDVLIPSCKVRSPFFLCSSKQRVLYMPLSPNLTTLLAKNLKPYLTCCIHIHITWTQGHGVKSDHLRFANLHSCRYIERNSFFFHCPACPARF